MSQNREEQFKEKSSLKEENDNNYLKDVKAQVEQKFLTLETVEDQKKFIGNFKALLKQTVINNKINSSKPNFFISFFVDSNNNQNDEYKVKVNKLIEDIPDYICLLFIRSKKYKMEEAITRYLNYENFLYTYDHHLWDNQNQILNDKSLIRSFTLSIIEDVLSSGLIRILRGRDKTGDPTIGLRGRPLVMIRPRYMEPERWDFFFKLVFFVIHQLLLIGNNNINNNDSQSNEKQESINEGDNLDKYLGLDCQLNGLLVINDMNGVSRSNISFNFIRRLAAFLFGAMPIRVGKIILCNEPWFFHSLPLLSFFPNKIKSRLLIIGSSYEILHENVDPLYLPASLGGKIDNNPNNTNNPNNDNNNNNASSSKDDNLNDKFYDGKESDTMKYFLKLMAQSNFKKIYFYPTGNLLE